jgi:hypothetical protein
MGGRTALGYVGRIEVDSARNKVESEGFLLRRVRACSL